MVNQRLIAEINRKGNYYRQKPDKITEDMLKDFGLSAEWVLLRPVVYFKGVREKLIEQDQSNY
jgi:hypothetical protein